MTTFKSINPYTNKEIAVHESLSEGQLASKLNHGEQAFFSWKKTSLQHRAQLLNKVAETLKANTEEYASMITAEMGKPIKESRAEITKCAWVCDYYAEHAAGFLADEVISTDAQKSFVRHDPLGTILAIMPWNFPFWQVFRFAAPTLMAGNTALLKHASNVLGCGKLIEEVFVKAGYPSGVFQFLPIGHEAIELVLGNESVKAVSLTGSEIAGKKVARIASGNLKRSLLELGGSNGFIVLKDADLEKAAEIAVNARMLNAGQSCIAAKRFLVEAPVHDAFIEQLSIRISKLKGGDPTKESTDVGPLARRDLAEKLADQLRVSLDLGARLHLGGVYEDCFFEPTLISNVSPEMPCFREETFGPLACVTEVKSFEEAIELANKSAYGLGVTVCTSNENQVLSRLGDFEDGAVFINSLVKSDPRLPFGGTKQSGFGRELGRDGILEFVNRKTVFLA
ncbi:MAG: NAD-dependent succinate-semialdehyde dehydrogenase [Flavobacteriales bacterium]|nr:NAD-dependent succinate-semialdehyde dehydrogenase [Flavobacteriales bacterium]MDG2246457.1 NAD-dependent succinate-semialdehyde dehydrogenase [Flavobacteriales bacterium]